jgi:K(+)-stimulated pyrophosphate-energized sodium pump
LIKIINIVALLIVPVMMSIHGGSIAKPVAVETPAAISAPADAPAAATAAPAAENK